MKIDKYRADIDGLRALAVLLVIGFHAFPNRLPGGFVGVDVFFVISGFLITGILYRGFRNGTFGFLDFWSRRIRRIFPSLLTVTVAIFIAGWFYLLPAEFIQLKSHIVWGLGFAANFKLNRELGYFDTQAELKPLLHFWSLAIEEQFYLLWPACLWICFKRNINLFIATLSLAMASFCIRRFINHEPSSFFYYPWTRFWELQTGALIAIGQIDYSEKINDFFDSIEKRVRTIWSMEYPYGQKYPLVSTAMSAVGSILILYSAFCFNKSVPFPSARTFAPVLGATLIIFGNSGWLNRNIFSKRLLVFIGLISFPLYLWHWPLLAFSRIIYSGSPSLNIIICAVLISFVLSILTWKFIEKPLRFENRRRWKSPCLACCLLFLATGISLIKFDPRSVRYDTEKIDLAGADNEQGGNPNVKVIGHQTLNGYPYDEIKSGRLESVLFIGDSHVNQYRSHIEKMIADSPAHTRSAFFLTGCLLANGYSRTDASHCKKYFGAVEDFINSDVFKNRIEEVVISQYWHIYLDTGLGDMITNSSVALEGDAKIHEMQKQIESFLASLKERHVKVTLVYDNAFGNEFDPHTMLKRTLKGFDLASSPSISRKVIEERRSVSHEWLKQLAARLDLSTIDPIEFLCSSENCPILDGDGRPLYFDSNHFTATTSRNLLSYIDPILKMSHGDIGSSDRKSKIL